MMTMHGYGIYVWSAYAFTAGICLLNVWQSYRSQQRAHKKIQRL